MKTYEHELDEMIDLVVSGLVWNHTIFLGLFEKKEAGREGKECEARRSHPEFFVSIKNSLLCSFWVTSDLLFCGKDKATSLCNLIKDVEVSKPELANKLNEKISAKKTIIKKIGIVRNQVCAHRLESKTPQEVFGEADFKLHMMKEIVDLACFIICGLADESGGNRRENIELKINKAALQFLKEDTIRVMDSFVEAL